MAATSLFLCQMAGAQAPRFPKRCGEHPAARPTQKVFIENVTFTGVPGPPGLSYDELIAMMRQRVLDAGSEWPTRAWDTVRSAWQDRGYFQAVVDVQPKVISSSAGERQVSLQVHVDPGPLYRVDEVHMLSTNPGEKLAFSNQRLRDAIPLRPGEILDLQKVRQGLASLQKLYASRGYIDFTAIPALHIEEETDRAMISFLLDQGRQYRVGTVQILGLDPYLKPELQARVVPGSIFDWNRVLDFYQTEKQSLLPGLSPSDDEVRRDRKTGKVDLILDFRACPQTMASSAAGHF